MIDYRKPEHREQYFSALYKMNLEHGVMPGLVYCYFPALSERFNWNDEQKLWFATINGCTQSPVTSLRIFKQSPQIPQSPDEWRDLDTWFNAEWHSLHFDTDRLKNKRNTIKALYSYAGLVKEAGSQVKLWSGKSYAQCWETASQIFSFGRLSTFSYLEYVKLMGFGAECDDLMFQNFDGSRSHRNGALFWQGFDNLVFDKRANNGFDGKYENFKSMCLYLWNESDEWLRSFKQNYPHKDANFFTLESQFCQFKNGFFRRRFPGCYADMGWDRIEWADDKGQQLFTSHFKEIRAAHLPNWLRIETEAKPLARAKRAAMFADTGIPFRAEYFLLGNNEL